MVPVRALARVVFLLAAHVLARQVDAALGVLLHTTLDVPALVLHVPELLDPARLAVAMARFLAGALLLWLAVAALASRRGPFPAAAERASRAFAPLLLRPAITVLAVLALAVRPTYPYGFTLPVALTQDWAAAQDLAALAALGVGLWGAWLGEDAGSARAWPRVKAPGPAAVWFLSFLAYSLLSPSWARQWEGHPGNEPKTLRMAVAIGHGLTLDVEGVSGPMEALQTRSPGEAVGRAGVMLVRESAAMARAILAGPGAVGSAAIRATRVTRQTVRGKDGGVYHVLAPGPSLLLAPALRFDRALNRASGRTGRLAVTLLLWNALAAALAAATFALVRDATRHSGLAAVVTGAFALSPPFLFYFYQFYPEMLGALSLALLLRRLLFGSRFSTRSALATALLLAFLPWLHQKFLPVFVALTLMAVVKAVDEMATLGELLALVVPQVVSLYLFGLYNFAITGSVRPDALFLAWGPAGVSGERLGQGLLGLALDARYGILPAAPLYMLGLAGLVTGGRAVSRLRLALPAVLVYYVTVAAADNWSGAVCSLGRYFMPAAPFLVALAAVALEVARGRRGAAVLALALAGWTGLIALALWRDPLAANDSAVLFARSRFADPHVYVPDLFFRSPRFEAPGHLARLAAWMAAGALVALWWRRAAAGRGGTSQGRVLAATSGLVLLAGLVLERWPPPYRTPRFPEAIELRPGTTVFASSTAVGDGDAVRVASGRHALLVRSRAELPSLPVVAAGDGTLSVPGRAPLRLRPGGDRLDLPLRPLLELQGRRGLREGLGEARFSISGEALVSFLPPEPLEDNQGNLGR